MKITPPETGSQPSLGATGIGGATAVPDAGDIPIAGGYFGAGTVEEALAAIAAELARLAGTGETRYWPMLALTSGPVSATGAHVSDTSAAHAASAVSFIPTAGIAATDVQAAIVEDAGDLTTHAGAADPHAGYVLEAATTTTLGNDAGAVPTTLILAGGTAGSEGGELSLLGAGANADWAFDNYTGRLRWYSGPNVYMDLGTTALALNAGLLMRIGGVAFPASPATNDVFYRTDLGEWYFFDGTRWLSTTIYATSLTPAGQAVFPVGVTSYPLIGPVPFNTAGTRRDVWLVGWTVITNVATTNNATNYWTVALERHGSGTSIVSFNTSADTAGTQTYHGGAIGALTGTSDTRLAVLCTKTAAPGNLDAPVIVEYRKVAT